MCGICGVAAADHTRTVDQEKLVRMTRSLTHRGPDDEGFFSGPGIGMGMRRLSIIDLESGRQPMLNEDETLVLVFNGEIYNYKELRQELISKGHRLGSQSDVEVVLHLYEDVGLNCLHRLRGMFAFALWDRKQKKLMLARDRFGIKPLYYTFTQSGDLVFGSENKAILALEGQAASLDVVALIDLFTLGFIVPPRSLFRDVKHLLPGHYLLYEKGSSRIHQYWDLNMDPGRDGIHASSHRYWAGLLADKIEETVRLHLRSDVEVGAWLSPGLDSSGVTAIMATMVNRPVNTFSVGFMGSKEADELNRKRTLDKYRDQNLIGHQTACRPEHFELMPKALWYREEPIDNLSYLPRYLLARASAQKVKVVLTGEGADEVFGGYPWYVADRLMRPLSLIPSRMRQWAAAALAVERWRPGFHRIFTAARSDDLTRFTHILHVFPRGFRHDLFGDVLKPSISRANAKRREFPLPDGFSQWHPYARMQYIEAKTRLAGYVILGLDRMSMACSLEARVPYLDHELVEMCADIPISLRIRWLQEKYILRGALAKWLPKDIQRRRKRGLTAPNQEWLWGDLPELVRELLSAESLRKKGYFSANAVANLLDQHRKKQRNWSRPLMAVLCVQMWDELFVAKRISPN